MLEIKTGSEIFQQHRTIMNPVDTMTMNVYTKNATKRWVSVESLKDWIMEYPQDKHKSYMIKDLYEELSPTIKVHMGEQK